MMPNDEQGEDRRIKMTARQTFCVLCLGVVAITILAGVALWMKVDGVVLATALSGIAALTAGAAGFTLRGIVTK